MPDEPSTPPGEHEEDDPGLLGGLLDKAGAATERFALRPARAVARQGRDALTDEAERTWLRQVRLEVFDDLQRPR